MNFEAEMFSSQKNNDFWDRPIIFSPKRIVRVTICAIIALSLCTMLWVAPGRRSSTNLAPLQDEAADSILHSASLDDNLKVLQDSTSSKSTDPKEASYSSVRIRS